MGAAVAPVISAVVSGFSAATALGGFSWASFAGSLILGGLSYALTPKPKMPNMPQNTGGSTVAVRQPDLTRQHVYGHVRITRGYAHMQSTGLNGTLHLILILCEGPLRAINEIWVNDYCIPNDWIDSEGNITQGRYRNYMTIRKHLGTDGQAADAKAIANMPVWTGDHRLQGSAYLYITMKKNQDVYPTGVPNVTAIVEGPSLYDPRVNGLRWTTNIAQYAADFLKNNVYGFGANDDDVDDVNTAAQMNICDEIVSTENLDTQVNSIATSTDIITLKGDVLQYQFGDRVRVLSTGSIPSGLSAGVDYYVIPYQIRTVPRILLATSLLNAMAKIAIDITSTGSGTITIRKTGEPRYHGSGVFDTEDNLTQTMNNLVNSMAGRATCIGGYWTLLAGAWRTPSLDLGISEVRGNGVGFKTDVPMSDSFNIVKGLYVSPVNFYQDSDYPSARYDQFIQDDNGIESPKEINLPFTTRPTTAQRIAKIELLRGRQGIVFTSDFYLGALQVQPGDTVNLNFERYGWEDKPFEITEFSFNVVDSNLVTSLTLRETGQGIYEWSGDEAIINDPAPNTNLPNPFDVLVPSGVNYNSRIVDTAGGDVIYIMQLQWDEHPDAFVREFGDFEIQYKLSADPEWLPSFFVDGSLTKTDVFNSSVNIAYDIRIRARNNLGVRSGWTTILNAIVGTSGGVGTTEDWETFSDPVGSGLVEDWETFSDPVGSGLVEDWGYFT